ncbi:multicopper oxidase family protein [Halomicrobium salinisoli]|uniref:multicopper oxidase family protein n=1 Tax=Halomicrobium salinisoli TaxID=2878391 RepID=UPI001CEFCF9B|nr:multicopper oxidase [Halomicrobium salinisoli]
MPRDSSHTNGSKDSTGSSGSSLVPRRSLIQSLGAIGLGGFVGNTASGRSHSLRGETRAVQDAQATASSPELAKWVDEVPRPGVIEPTGTKDGQPYYEVEMREVEQSLHRDLPPTTVWGYDGQYPGPTIEARRGEPVYVRWKNKLPDEHLLPVDTTIHGDEVPYDSTGVRVVTHLHGGNVEHTSDGKPQAWFTRDFEETGPKFEKKDYYYVNDQPAATLWYHDHSLGITRLNVYAGLAGFYLLRSGREDELGLPAGEYEIPLVLQDRTFNDDGSLFYPTGPSDGDGSGPEPSIIPQFYGDTSVVNGKAWPRLTVEPRTYRLRLLNGSNSRFYNLKLVEYDETAGTTGADGPPLTLVGNDGGLLAQPRQVDDRLQLGSSGRADVVVDFSDYAGSTLLLHNDAPAEFRGSVATDDDVEPLPEVLLVDVEDASDGDDTSQVPSSLGRVPDIPVESADRNRHVTLATQTDEYGRLLHLLGTGEEPLGNRLYDPATETPRKGTTEIWSIANLTGMSHPVHLHLVHFQVLGHQSYSDFDPEADSVDPETLSPPKQGERGWNDVVTVDPGQVTHVIVHFGEYEGLFNDQTGWYMWHCHMLEHEDHDMMRPLRVLPEEEDDEETCEFPADDANRSDGGPIFE